METIIRFILLFIAMGVVTGILYQYKRQQKRRFLSHSFSPLPPVFSKNSKEPIDEKTLAADLPVQLPTTVNQDDLKEDKLMINLREFNREEDEELPSFVILKEEEIEPSFEKAEEDEKFEKETIVEKRPEEIKASFLPPDSVTNETALTEDFPANEVKKLNKEELLIISITAGEGHSFTGYDLMQALSANGLRYDEQRIFHYYDDQTADSRVLFSVASATAKGDFDLDNIGNFFCKGLILFTDIKKQEDPLLAFDLLVDTASQLAEDLGGNLKINFDQPWCFNSLKQLREEISSIIKLV